MSADSSDRLKLLKENARLRELIRINQRLHSSLDVDFVLETIVDVATRSLEAERSTLYVMDSEKGEIWSRVVQGNDIGEIRLKLGQGIAGYVAKTGETVRIPDAHGDNRFYPNVDAESGFCTRSMLCMPLQERGETLVGVLQVMNKENGEFTVEDEEYLRALCVQATLSLQNAQHTTRLSTLSNENQQLVEILEQRLRDLQSIKMVSMKHMARGIAHEINNALAKIMGGVESLQQNVGDLRGILEDITCGSDMAAEELQYLLEEGLPLCLRGVLEGSSGISEIVKGIRNFVRLDQEIVQFCDLNDDVRTVVEVCATDLSEGNVTLETELKELPRVECREMR